MSLSRQRRLEEVAEVTAGNPAPQELSDFSPDGPPFVRMQDVGRTHWTRSLISTVDRLATDAVTRHRLRLFPRGTLLVPKSGASVNLNHRALLGIDAYVVSHLAAIVPDVQLIDPEYLYFWSLTYDPRHQAQTTSLPSLPTFLIKEAQLPVPPLPEQRRIVDLLARAEGIVRLRREARQKAAELIPAIFVDMFGDPATNPKGWSVATLGEVLVSGPSNGLYKHKSAYGTGTPILRIDGFYDGVIKDLVQLKRVRLDDEDEVRRFALAEGDIVVNRVNSPEYLGKSAIVPRLAEPTVFESNMMRFSVDKSRVLPGFVIALLQQPASRRHLLANAKHAINQSSINQQDVKSVRVPLPPVALQQVFAQRIGAVASIRSQQAEATNTAQASFNALLANAFRAA